MVVMRADGTGARLVSAPRGAEDFDPTWSRTGRLAFIRHRPAGPGAGYVHEIVSVGRTGRDQRVLVPSSRYAFRSLAWSPDGRTLAFTVPYADRSSEFAVGLFLLEPDRTRPRFLLRAAGMGEVGWSPDGTTIVLAASVPGAEPYDPYRLFTIRVSDRRIVQLTRVPYIKTLDGEPRWSPDGKQIVFTRSDPTRAAIYSIRPDGRGERLVASDARGAAWSADSRRLAFVDGVSGAGRRLTLSVIAMPDRRVLMRTALRRPLDADGLSAQAWRP
jgi:Tol biopolymer transport system component